MSMTLPEIATAYARIDKVWRSATRQSKKTHLGQLAQLDTAAAADLDLQQPEVRDLVREIRVLRGRIPAIDTVTIRYVPRPTTTLPLVDCWLAVQAGLPAVPSRSHSISRRFLPVQRRAGAPAPSDRRFATPGAALGAPR